METNKDLENEEQFVKKQWVKPEMDELSLNTGLEPGPELSTYLPS